MKKMWENTVKPDRSQMAIWRMRIACWIPKAKNTHSDYVMFIVFQLQPWLPDLACMLRYTE